MKTTPYILSFTGASLAISESVKIAEVYLRLRDWEAVKPEVKRGNLIQTRTLSSFQRVYQELQPRLAGLSLSQLELLVDGSPQEQRQLLWFAICKRYFLIRDFASEVVREKFLRMDYQLTEFDYDSFFNRKADWHPELDELSETSRQKIKTRVLRMLTEAEIIDSNLLILPTLLSQRVQDALAVDAPMSFEIFPVSNY